MYITNNKFLEVNEISFTCCEYVNNFDYKVQKNYNIRVNDGHDKIYNQNKSRAIINTTNISRIINKQNIISVSKDPCLTEYAKTHIPTNMFCFEMCIGYRGEVEWFFILSEQPYEEFIKNII